MRGCHVYCWQSKNCTRTPALEMFIGNEREKQDSQDITRRNGTGWPLMAAKSIAMLPLTSPGLVEQQCLLQCSGSTLLH